MLPKTCLMAPGAQSVERTEDVEDPNQTQQREAAGPVDPPQTSLSFSMSADLFHAARAAAAGSPESWSHIMYQSITDTGAIDRVRVHCCTSKHTMEYVCQNYFVGEPVLGFDLEWSALASRASGPCDNVSLIQLASPSQIAILHVALFPHDDLVAPTFRRIMEDPAVTKVGVHIQANCTRLNNHLGFRARGLLELSHLHKLVKYVAAGRPDRVNKILVSLST